jgi:hypothetical protein
MFEANSRSPSVLDYPENAFKENVEPDNHGKLTSKDVSSILNTNLMYTKKPPAKAKTAPVKEKKSKTVKRGSGDTADDVLRTNVDWSCERRKLAFLNALKDQKGQYNTYNKISRFISE